jgi:Flp pilus assembly protein TadD
MSEVEDHPRYSIWRAALARLIRAQERLADARPTERPSLQMEYEDALVAYLAIVDEL